MKGIDSGPGYSEPVKTIGDESGTLSLLGKALSDRSLPDA
jgi:hypothetical protein